MPQARNSERPRGSRGTLSGRLGLLSLGLALLASPVPTRSPAPPRRVVALAPSAAEILFALGAAPRVVGVPDFADDLPEAAGKARVGGFAPDLERVVALAPDLVVVSKDGTDRAAYEKLEALGLTVVVTSGTTLAGVLEDVARVGHALGEDERARALVLALTKRIAAAEALGRAAPAGAGARPHLAGSARGGRRGHVRRRRRQARGVHERRAGIRGRLAARLVRDARRVESRSRDPPRDPGERRGVRARVLATRAGASSRP